MRLIGRWPALAIVAMALALVLTALTVGTPADAARAGDPTWAEVQQAKRNAAAKAAEVKKIQGLLTQVQARAARLSAAAVQAAAASAQAEAQVRSAQRTLDGLRSQAKAAKAKAAKAKRTAAAVATQLYRGGDPTLSVWLSGKASGTLLYQLGALSRIGDSSSALLVAAVQDQRAAQALSDQADVQAKIRDVLAKKAKALADRAHAAQVAADQQVAATKQRVADLRTKLAQLQDRASSLEESYKEAQAAKARAAAAGAGGGANETLGGGGGAGSLSPAGAQSYASGRMGAYGWGSSQFSCLVSLWNIESGWRWDAYNASSGAYGIPQALPADKLATSGSDWRTSSATQIEWGLGYIRGRYGSPCGAYAFETSHIPYWY